MRCATGVNPSCSTGYPFYRCYETSDGRYVAVGAIEPQFFAALLRGLELSPDEVPNQLDTGSYARMRDTFAERFAGRTRDAWVRTFAGTDACVTPVLTWGEAATDGHLRARATVITAHGADQAAPARASRAHRPDPSGPTRGHHTPHRDQLVARLLRQNRPVARRHC